VGFVRNSRILFIVALLVVAWFGTEDYTSQNICVTTCESLVGLTPIEQAIAVAILPVLLAIGGFYLIRKEKSIPKHTGDNAQDQTG
jgi:hypothetical protein